MASQWHGVIAQPGVSETEQDGESWSTVSTVPRSEVYCDPNDPGRLIETTTGASWWLKE
jgi:hypothetical protein